jgi:hypothetical protein
MTERRVWHFENLDSWKDDVRKLLEPEVDDQVVRAFLARPPKYVVGDDLSWLDDIVERVRGYEVDMKSNLTMRLHDRYDAIRGYHGARPLDVATYYERGLTLLEADAARRRATEIFLSGRFPDLDAATLEKAITDVGFKYREGRLYFETGREFLEEHCGHYLLYGSEFLCGVAAHLPPPRDWRQVLKEFGRPTVFACDVPLDYMGFNWVADFAGQAIETLFERLLDPDYVYPPPGRGAGIEVRRPLPADHIVAHYHPTRIPDPLLGRRLVEC